MTDVHTGRYKIFPLSRFYYDVVCLSSRRDFHLAVRSPATNPAGSRQNLPAHDSDREKKKLKNRRLESNFRFSCQFCFIVLIWFPIQNINYRKCYYSVCEREKKGPKYRLIVWANFNSGWINTKLKISRRLISTAHKVGSCVVFSFFFLSRCWLYSLPFFSRFLRQVACGFYNASAVVNRSLIVFESSISAHFIYRKAKRTMWRAHFISA